MTVPYTFGSATSAIPLSQLDSNFATAITLGNTAVYLGNTTTSIGNLTLANVTISSVSTAITVAQGGTGATNLTANNVILGNGTSALQVVAPGTSGNILTSNGTTWISSAPAGGGGVSDNVVVVYLFAAYGTTNTAISNYASLAVNTGTAITYASSASLGDSFTINEAGYYQVYTVASVASSVAFGASVNSTQLSTAISSITFANRVIAAGGGGSSSFAPWTSASIIIKCAIGDVIRPHCTPGYGQAGSNRDVFIVRKVGNV